MRRSVLAKKPGQRGVPDYRLSLHLNYLVARRGLPSTLTFRKWMIATLHTVGYAHHNIELSLRLVNQAEAKRLNRRYRGRDYATNVLSFPVDLPVPVDPILLGDLVICAPVVAREAKEQGKLLRHHYAHLTIHGLMHLLGYDHQTARAAEQMEAMEKQILALFAISNPYEAL